MKDVCFIFLDTSSLLVDEWKKAVAEHLSSEIASRITILHATLELLEPPVSLVDCIVSPANSYGIMDGGFDYYLSRALNPAGDTKAATRIAQSTLSKRWKGYALPGTCTLVSLKDTDCEDNLHQCGFIALCPTMRVPDNVAWNREIVYNCMWSLLCAIEEHNSAVSKAGEGRIIKSVLLTGLGTGTGFVPLKQCAQQMVLALHHFYDAVSNPDDQVGWGKAHGDSEVVRQTYAGELGLKTRASVFKNKMDASGLCIIA